MGKVQSQMFKQAVLPVCACLCAVSVAQADPVDHGQWSGFYTGATLNNAGGTNKTIGNRFTFNQNQAVNRVDHSYEGFGLSGFIGWNKRVGRVVYGGEFSLSADDLSSELTFNADNDIDQVEIQWSGNITGRYGQVYGDTLLYAKGGVSFARIRNIGGDVNGGALTLSDAYMRNDLYFGPLLAIGAERFFNENWLLRVEYSITDYGNFTQANQDGVPNSQRYTVSNGPVQKLSLGVAFQF
nr:outer membrane beta-barrel protein [Roseovarius sp. W115]